MSTSLAIPPELVERVIEVTGTGEAEAAHLLGACANDVEAAIALYFEQGNDAENAVGVEAAVANNINNIGDDDDNVRAPIAPVREQLIRPEDDNFYVAAAPPPPTTGRIAHTAQRVKVCPFRDFAREGALMEQELQAAGDAIEGFMPPVDGFDAITSRSRLQAQARSSSMVSAARGARAMLNSRLGDLFRPPTDISYAGSFQAVRTRATQLKCWLLVNVQNDNFNSQLLNRDVWSNKDVRKLLRRRFLLWQVDADSSEGRRFVTFYHCAKIPYVCVIDPRTGEEIWRSPEPKLQRLLPDLQKFVQENKDFSSEIGDDMPTTSKRPTSFINIADNDDDDDDDDDDVAVVNGASSKPSTSGPIKKRSKVMELSEEEQVALAIRNSMHENGAKTNGRTQTKTTTATGTDAFDSFYDDDDDNSSGGSVEELCEADTEKTSERSFEDELGKGVNEQTMIKLRLLNEKGIDEATTLRWPSDTKLKVLRLYIGQKHSHIPKQGYKIICAFPRKTLEAENDESTLKEFGLHPSANLHVTIDD